MLSFIYFIFLSIAQATVNIKSSDIIGKWTEGSCKSEQMSFSSDGIYEYMVWNGSRYNVVDRQQWWIEDGIVFLGYKGVAATLAIAADAITKTSILGGYASAVGDKAYFFMIRCY